MTNLEAAGILGKMHKCGSKGCPVEIDVPCEECPYNVTDEQGEEVFRMAIEALRNQSEIIRCKDCIHYEYGKDYYDYCNKDNGLCEVSEESFCSFAERRTDE